MDSSRQSQLNDLINYINQSLERDKLREDVDQIKERIINLFKSTANESVPSTSIKGELDSLTPSSELFKEYKDYDTVYAYGYNVFSCIPYTSGVGVWIADNHPGNVSLPVTIAKPRISDFLACLEALNAMYKLGAKKVKVYVNTPFVVNCLERWIETWNKTDWITKQETEVQNKQIIKDITLMRGQFFSDVKFIYTESEPGMIKAGKLAVEGTSKRFSNDPYFVLPSQYKYQFI